MDRLNKTAISAMKQTLKAKLPKINSSVKLNDFINRNNREVSSFFIIYRGYIYSVIIKIQKKFLCFIY